jgi:hypothetical protein
MRYKFGDLIQIKYLYEPVVFIKYVSDNAAIIVKQDAFKAHIEISNILGPWGSHDEKSDGINQIQE